MGVQKPFLLYEGDLIDNQYKINCGIGKGGFGEVYSAFDIKLGRDVALKLELRSKKRRVIKMEAYVLKKLQGMKHVCEFYEYRSTEYFSFITMELQEKSLSEIRKNNEGGVFSLGATFRLALQMLEAIEEVHTNGFLHRDIKPGNFVLSSGKNGKKLFILDFGLCRQFLCEGTQRQKKERAFAPFRGTVRYASVNAHKNKETGRRDDLWSLFYIIVEFITGTLPWHRMRHKGYVGKIKEKFNHNVGHLPLTCRLFVKHVASLKRADEPNYKLLASILKDGILRLQNEDSILNGWTFNSRVSAPLSSSSDSTAYEYIQDDKEPEKSSLNGNLPPIHDIQSSHSQSTNVTNFPSLEDKLYCKRSVSPIIRKSKPSREDFCQFTRQVISLEVEPEVVAHDSGLGGSAVNLEETLKNGHVFPYPPDEPCHKYNLVTKARMKRYYCPKK